MPLRQRVIRRGAAAADRAARWLGNALERHSHADRFFVANKTPSQVIYGDGLMTLRYYPPLQEPVVDVAGMAVRVEGAACAVPLLLVPPLAANSMIFDLLPQRSLVKYLRARGFAVYLVDWGDPEARHVHYGLRHYTTEMLPAAVQAMQAHAEVEEYSLLGYCMGGLFSLIHAGWAQDPALRNIVTIASPIDYHQMGRAGELLRGLNLPVRLIRHFTPFRVRGIHPRFLRVPGPVSSLAFKLTNPLGTLQAYLDLLMNLGDREYVTEHTTTAAWFNRMHDYPGGIVQDFFVRVGLDNDLARGRIRLGKGRESRLYELSCALLAIAGAQDQIVPVQSAARILDVVGSADKHFMVAPGGHAGVFGGSRAPHNSWRMAADFLLPRSGPPTGQTPRREHAG